MGVSSIVREQSFQPLCCMVLRQGEVTERLKEDKDLRHERWWQCGGDPTGRWRARLWMALKVYKNYGVDSDFNQDPVKLLDHGADVVKGDSSGNTSSCRGWTSWSL